eukprot:scaffold18638_cov66-Phaeocystis_antarctica.AAC.3
MRALALLLLLIATAVTGQQTTTTEDVYYRASDVCGQNPPTKTESAVCVSSGTATLPASLQPAGYTAKFGEFPGWGLSVRCCNDATPMACKSDAAGTCFGTAQRWTQADAICTANGLRLCTVAELTSCCGTGCEYDSSLVWTSERCSPAVPLTVLQPQQCVTTADGEVRCIQIPEGGSLQDARVQAMIKRSFGSALA